MSNFNSPPLPLYSFIVIRNYSRILTGSYDQLKDRRMKDVINILWFPHYIKQIDSRLPCVFLVIDLRRRQNVVTTLVTHSLIASCATFCRFLPHFDVIGDQLLNRRTATWNLPVKSSLINNSVLLMQQYILPSNTSLSLANSCLC